MKARLASGRLEAEESLLADRGGTACAAAAVASRWTRSIRALYDFAATHVYRPNNPSAAERMAVVAVGGYGRGTLAPGSDIDLLFLLPYKQTPWGEQVVEFMLYVLWDLGPEGRPRHPQHRRMPAAGALRHDHPHRDPGGALPLGRRSRSTTSSLRRFDREVVQRHRPGIRRRPSLPSATSAIAKAGESRYLVEPNVKDGKGGLRDLHTLFWIAKYFYRVRDRRGLVEKGVFTRAEYRQFQKAEDFLWAVRCHMHFLTGKAEERLHFDIQREIAERLGYTSHPGLSAVERFMKHYFLVAKDVGDLTRIFCAALEEEQAKHVPGFNRIFLPLLARASASSPAPAISSSTTTASTSPTTRCSSATRSICSGCSGSPTSTGWSSIPTRCKLRHPLARPDRPASARRCRRPTGCSSTS